MIAEQMKKIAFVIASLLIFLALVGSLSLNEGAKAQREQIKTFEKVLEAERESFAVQEEEYTRELAHYKDKNRDLELTNEILADQIRLKNQELEWLE